MGIGKYNPDIDALRALSVMLVFLFHLDGVIPGGYVGVDVFFVISGFLITKILVGESASGNGIDGVKFVKSRIRRLFPAQLGLYFLVVFTSWVLVDPKTYIDISNSVVWSTLSLSNVYYLMSSGYFDESSINNPLLHTWSLSLEQQFYIAIFLVVFLLSKTKYLPHFLLVSFTASLAISTYVSAGNKDAAYYLLFSRWYEFLVGSFVYYISLRGLTVFRNWVIGLLGLALIVLSAFTFDSEMVFPGYFALIPTIGAALLMLHFLGNTNDYFGRESWLVKVGRGSYSIYLVHWPVIVFYRYYVFRELNYVDMFVIALITFAISYLLYSFVEKRFRYSRERNSTIWISLAVMISAVSFVIYTDGRASRTFEERAMDSAEFHQNAYGGNGSAQGTYEIGKENGDVSYALLGDSYSRQYIHAIEQNIQGKAIVSLADGCFFSDSYTSFVSGKPRQACFDRLNDLQERLKETPDIPVFIGINWGGYSTLVVDENGNRKSFEDGSYNDFILDSILKLQSVLDRDIYVLGAPPGLISGDQSLRNCVERPSIMSHACKDRLSSDISVSNSRNLMLRVEEMVSNHDRMTFVDMTKPFCVDGTCEPLNGGEYIYSDAHHLSKAGAKIAISYYKELFE
ncbi:acyltransferase [Vibrio europaeus]|uniref:acyltransferase family protein n=1 Tax=Vibrio europaeus TaxID=300876 RepID=UPI00233F03A9|nr:acyltransferase family protein [Vibrio europaeus]MDC5804527.1 acyltransferase [Vibrio europaeus]MDC5808625.1 acyltransferase [Vibrio europaeus]MDC5825115.1 acyltransferase [Vibrio europaeus]MDC5829512.1 acyltransferase [Vibrio europaeus]MDC5836070.1 acyltransferase [Vibrio europaeus]